MLREATRRLESTDEITELEKRELELWLRYRELDRYFRQVSERGSKQEARRARTRAIRAHSEHQKCLNTILKVHEKRLLEQPRVTL